MFKSSRRSLLACLVIFTIIFSSLPIAFATDSSAALATTEQDGVKGADAALAQGRTLLRRNRADQALPLVESALEMYTRANAQNGMAAAQDVAGDIYVQQGQYDTALDLYGRALQIFRAQKDMPNINLLLAKIGETQYL
ncbi:MAG: tetratricopeptide repeat protein, partial [Pyrinomonadaceae bacterium]|nr:tetratricopeptide repeat protein [Pyrinomonadaceae bacterium]